MSLHAGEISGEIGGRHSSLAVMVVHCDVCPTVLTVATYNEQTALDEARNGEWLLGDGDQTPDLCPDCAAKAEVAS